MVEPCPQVLKTAAVSPLYAVCDGGLKIYGRRKTVGVPVAI